MIGSRHADRPSRRLPPRAAVTSIEFAVVALCFVTLVIILLEIGWQLLADGALNYGAREASRFGVTGAAYPASMASNPPATRELAVAAVVVDATGGFLQASSLTVTLASYPQFGSTSAPASNAGGPSNAVQYTLTYMQPFLTSIASSIVGHPYLMHTTTFWVENEPFPTP